MGYNTVVVLFNDQQREIEKPTFGEKLSRAMRSWVMRDHYPLATWFNAGEVISQEHANYTQIVIAGKNTGKRLFDCGPDDLDTLAQEQLANALKLCGWTVKPPSKQRKKL